MNFVKQNCIFVLRFIRGITVDDLLWFFAWMWFGAGYTAAQYGDTIPMIILFTGWSIGMLYFFIKFVKRH
jgi:hypothetical protein